MEISSRIDYAISIASLVDGERKNCTLRKSLTGKVSLCCGYRPRDVASGMEGGMFDSYLEINNGKRGRLSY